MIYKMSGKINDFFTQQYSAVRPAPECCISAWSGTALSAIAVHPNGS